MAGMNSDFINTMVVLAVIGGGIKVFFELLTKEKRREKRTKYYRDDYLKSDDWKRKRRLVLKRDNYRCVYCGKRATQVHHKRYAPQNIGREPIEWLVSVCCECHGKQHDRQSDDDVME